MLVQEMSSETAHHPNVPTECLEIQTQQQLEKSSKTDIFDLPECIPRKTTPKFIYISTVVIYSSFPETEVFFKIEYSIPPFSKMLIDFCPD